MLNTIPLQNHAAGPFSIAFQFADGNGPDDGDNVAILSDFDFGTGGLPSGSPQLIGSAGGDLVAQVILTDSESVNFFAQTFVAGTQLRFILTLSTNIDDGTIADTFVFSLLDKTGTPLPTSAGAPLDGLAVIRLDSEDPPIEIFGSDPTRFLQGGGAPLNNVVPSATKSGFGLRFVPLSPCRVVDTRPVYAGTRSGAFGPPSLSAGSTRTIPVTASSTCSIPPVARAFVFNVTVDTIENQTGPVDLVTIWPAGQTRPAFSNIRTTTGGYIANAAIVAGGTDGAVNVYTSHATNLILDISGYFSDEPGSAGLLYYPMIPCRAVDTRGPIYSSLPPPFGNQRFQARENRTFRLPGSPACQIPAAYAYSMQLTLAPGEFTNGNSVAFVTAYPTGMPQPNISNLNAFWGYAVANSAIVPASSNGSIDIFAFDPTNLIIDVNGYFAPDDGTGRGLQYFPVTQCRVMDTQSGLYSGAFGPPAMSSNADRTIPIPASGCVGLPQTTQAWSVNAVAVPNGVGMPYMSLWPSGTAWPNISQLNAFQGQTVANSGIVPSSANGSIDVRVAGPTHVILEIGGYFSR